MGNEHWNYMCLCICVYCFTQPLNLTDLGENHLWMKRIQFCRNTEHHLISKLKYSILRNTKTPSWRLGVGCGPFAYFRTILVFNQRFSFIRKGSALERNKSNIKHSMRVFIYLETMNSWIKASAILTICMFF